MKKFIVLFIALIFIFPINVNKISNGVSNENKIVLVSDSDAFYTLIATPLSFHEGKIPLLLFKENLTRKHERFIEAYNGNNFIVIGKHIDDSYPKQEFIGNATSISIKIAERFYGDSKFVVILPYEQYNLSLIATPIACYLDAPVLIYNGSDNEIENACKSLNADKIIGIGNISVGNIHLKNESQIYGYINSIKNVSYVALTNPDDELPLKIMDMENIHLKGHITNVKITLFAKEFNLIGNDEKTFYIDVPDGINKIEAYINISKHDSIPYIILATLYDENGKLATYSSSFAYSNQKCYIDTLSINNKGKYKLVVKVYHGIKGGYFSERGISVVNVDFSVDLKIKKFTRACIPYLHASKLTPYLACSHNGIVIESRFATKEYEKAANHTTGGAWNNKFLQNFVNRQVNKTVDKLKKFIGNASMVAIVGDSNMIPMFYYNGSNDVGVGLGIPSDNPYYLNFSVAAGRIIAWDSIDASLLINRNVFYNKIAHGSWMKNFTFIFGEGFGETGGIFHQLPYSKVVKQHGFNARIFGDLKNDRKALEKYNAFDANYIEYEGHGNWFWMFSSIYGLNYLNKVVDVSHVKNYELNPSVVLAAACLMARVDGIPLRENIGLAFIHAGANAFIGATRETGREAELEFIENNLIENDTSIGFAIQNAKIYDKPPTKYARVLYGDPAFNPYEPK